MEGGAIVDDVVSFFERKGWGPRLGRTHRLRVTDVADLISHLVNVTSGDAMGGNGDPEMRRRLRTLIHEQALIADTGLDGTDSVDERNQIHSAVVPSIIRHFLNFFAGVDKIIFSKNS